MNAGARGRRPRAQSAASPVGSSDSVPSQPTPPTGPAMTTAPNPAMKTGPRVTVSFRLPQDLHQLAVARAKREERSFSAYVRRAIQRDLDQTAKEGRTREDKK